MHRLVCGKINCKPDRGLKGEAHPHELLWIQEAVLDGRIKLTKISGGHNPADVLSKPMSVSDGKLQSIGIEILS